MQWVGVFFSFFFFFLIGQFNENMCRTKNSLHYTKTEENAPRNPNSYLSRRMITNNIMHRKVSRAEARASLIVFAVSECLFIIIVLC